MPNTLTLFPGSDELPSGDSTISNADYYSVIVESAFNNLNDNFWQHNDLTLGVTMNFGVKSLQQQVFSDHVEGASGRIGVNRTLLMQYIPCNGDAFSIGVSFVRSDKDDFIPKLLGLLSASQTNPAVTQYVASAVPYLEIAGQVGQQIYDLIEIDHGSKLVETTPSALLPSGRTVDRGTLRDCFLLQYTGPDNMQDDALYVANGEVIWKANGSPLRSGPWVLFRIQRFHKRPDQSLRSWDQLFQKSIAEFSGYPGANPSQADQEFASANTLLQSDADITAGDKAQILHDYFVLFQAAKRAHDQNPLIVARGLAELTRESNLNGKAIRRFDPTALRNWLMENQ